jgi:hypothetical protein
MEHDINKSPYRKLAKLIPIIFIMFNLKIHLVLSANETVKLASVSKDKDGNFVIEDGLFDPKKYIASAKYTVGLESLGWDLLAISTNKNFEDEVQAEAAGFLEGYLTQSRIWDHWRNLNIKTWKNDTDMPEYVKTFFKDQATYVEDLYKANKTDKIAANAYYLQLQLRGLINAYNGYAPLAKVIGYLQFHTMTSFGDLFDIVNYQNPSHLPKYDQMSAKSIASYLLSNNHCSALFKVKEDFSEIFFGHNSWFYYSAMTRIFKEYNFNFNHPSIKSRNIFFSSYPATLASMDDFYVTSQDLVVIETTNPNFNNDLYSRLTPKSLLCWQRAMIANRLSSNSKEWTENFAIENSGTYNNMFMVLDMKLVDLENKAIQNGALHIIEQLPGYTETTDVTQFLKYGYWPSYNVPFAENVRVEAKILDMVKSKPELTSILDYNTCARANILRRDQGNVSTMEDFKKLIRYNNYQKDPFSNMDPSLAIACRADLVRSCQGAYDAKVSSVSLAKGKYKTFNIIQGPTYDNVPAFSWTNSESCKTDPHYGMPDEYKFEWYQYKNEFVDEVLYGESLGLELAILE